jgi:hypothetical protein
LSDVFREEARQPRCWVWRERGGGVEGSGSGEAVVVGIFG